MSSRKIEDLVPALVNLFYRFKDECDRQGLDFVVTCTKRTIAEQEILVAQRKSKTMNSKHLTGRAFDIMALKHGKPTWQFEDYIPYGTIGESSGLEWGGSWTKFKDGCHFQLRE
jgi:peptidoglycan LD-endopeptidase CwlK